jgi:hypothetical protein
MLTVPFESGSGAYDFRTTIDGVEYFCDVRWNSSDNERRGAWYFDLYEQDLTPIAVGIKIVLGTYLGKRVQHRLFRTGVMIALDMTKQGKEATFDDLGTRVEVRWVPVEEALSLIAEAGLEV